MPEQSIITIDLLKQSMEALNIIYDVVRIIDPLQKKVMVLSDAKVKDQNSNCYAFWNQSKICDNCISMRAYQQKEVFFKLEYSSEKICMVTAIPVQDKDKLVILEVMKDVTKSLVIHDPNNMESNEVIKILNKINQLHIRDGLTGLYNRRFINERLPIEMINNSIDPRPVSIILADIDHFKQVNDMHGHIAGDFVLKEFSSLLMKHIDTNDGWVSRYGGEEFLISLKNVDVQKAQSIAEEIRKAIENEIIEYEGKDIRITCSFGVSTLYSSKDIVVEDFIQSADKNLYTAKSTGRNKVVAGKI